jgi:hypothetical protein
MKPLVRSLTGLSIAAVMAVSPVIAVAQEATPEAPVTLGDVRVIGVQTLANDLTVDETTVGGLSGIDYDPETDR